MWNQKEEKSGNQNQITDQQAGVLFLGLIALGIAGKWEEIKNYFFQNLEVIGLIAFGIVAGFAALIYWQLKKRTQKLQARIKKVRPLRNPRNGILAGKTPDGAPVYIPDQARQEHVQIIGSTGRGKTQSVVVPWVVRDLKAGRDVVVIDGKGGDIDWKIEGYLDAVRTPYELKRFRLGHRGEVQPLEHGSAQQITDRLFTTFQFEDPYYKAVQYETCGAVIRAMQELGEEVSLCTLYTRLTDDQILSGDIKRLKNEVLKRKLTNYLAEPKRSRDEKIKGLTAQLSPFAIGEIAEGVNGGEKTVSIAELLTEEKTPNRPPRVYVFVIPTLEYQAIGHQTGKLLLQELAWAVAERERLNRTEFLPVYLDEFSAFVYEGFGDILNKARSSGVALHLSHQSLGDLTRVSGSFAQIVNTNSNVKCILGLNDPETADFFARHIGTRTTEKLTERAQVRGWFKDQERTGESSIREVESYRVHPNLLKNFTRGQGVLHFPTAHGNFSEEIDFQRISNEDYS